MKVFAAAEHKDVPTAVEKRMGIVVGRGDKSTPDIAVRTTRIVSRLLASCE